MLVTPVKTEKITPGSTTLLSVLDANIQKFPDRSVLAVTSKIISICEGSVVKQGTIDKDELIRAEAEQYIPKTASNYDVTLTIKRGILAASAGIDESNGSGYFVLWPENPQKSANAIRAYLVKRFHIQYAGVVITDSRSFPLRWGTTGVAIAHSGFAALNSYIGTPDIFGRTMLMTKSNVADALAESAVTVMGEGNEQTPLATIRHVPFVRFQDRNPTDEELAGLTIDINDDLYAPLLTAVPWKKKRT